MTKLIQKLKVMMHMHPFAIGVHVELTHACTND